MDVLIVDDSAAIRKILKRVLQQAEIPTGQVYEASDGVEAIERLKEQPVQLILSDINMPNMDGLALAEAVREQFPALPIILISGFSNSRGEFEFVRKPFAPGTLLTAVRKAMVGNRNSFCALTQGSAGESGDSASFPRRRESCGWRVRCGLDGR